MVSLDISIIFYIKVTLINMHVIHLCYVIISARYIHTISFSCVLLNMVDGSHIFSYQTSNGTHIHIPMVHNSK